jgi:hypothetical protein
MSDELEKPPIEPVEPITKKAPTPLQLVQWWHTVVTGWTDAQVIEHCKTLKYDDVIIEELQTIIDQIDKTLKGDSSNG